MLVRSLPSGWFCHFLEKDRNGGKVLADALQAAMDGVGHCEKCRTLSEDTLCRICQNPARDQQTICVVETPADVFAVEQTASYKGLYFVLMGHLSPIDGIGPDEIGIGQLTDLVTDSDIYRDYPGHQPYRGGGSYCLLYCRAVQFAGDAGPQISEYQE